MGESLGTGVAIALAATHEAAAHLRHPRLRYMGAKGLGCNRDHLRGRLRDGVRLSIKHPAAFSPPTRSV